MFVKAIFNWLIQKKIVYSIPWLSERQIFECHPRVQTLIKHDQSKDSYNTENGTQVLRFSLRTFF